jgi:hypothetical protein
MLCPSPANSTAQQKMKLAINNQERVFDSSQACWVTTAAIIRHDGVCAYARYGTEVRPPGDLFMGAVAPGSVAPDRVDEHYKSDAEYVFAVADALHDEYKAIVDTGLILQVDDAYLALSYEVMVPPKTLRDYRKWAALRIEALNHALKGLPEERTCYHVCWGSWNGPHAYDVRSQGQNRLALLTTPVQARTRCEGADLALGYGLGST